MPTNEQRREAAKRKLERQLVRRAERARKRRVLGVVSTIVGVVVVVGLVYLLTTIGGDDTPTEPAAQEDPLTTTTTRPKELPPQLDCAYPVEEGTPAAKDVEPPPTSGVSTQGTVAATIKLSTGELKATLDRAKGPCAVNSFVNLAKQDYFDSTPCHRITTSASLSVLQCGDPTGKGNGGPGYTFDDEVYPDTTYPRGTLAMANAGTDPQTGKGTNGSQFFIVYGENAQLPPNYTVFGSVDPASLAVVDAIAEAGVAGGGEDGAPKNAVSITDVTVAG